MSLPQSPELLPGAAVVTPSYRPVLMAPLGTDALLGKARQLDTAQKLLSSHKHGVSGSTHSHPRPRCSPHHLRVGVAGDVVVLQCPTLSPAGHTGSTSSLGPPHRGHWGPRLGPGPSLPVRVLRLARSLPRLRTWEPEPRMLGTGGAGMRSRGCWLHRLSPSAEFAPPGWLLSEPLWWAGRPRTSMIDVSLRLPQCHKQK